MHIRVVAKMARYPHKDSFALGTRLYIQLVPARTFQMGTVLVWNVSYGNTTRASSRDQITWCIAILSKSCK